MTLFTRREIFKWFGRMALAGASLATYSLVIEPGFRLLTKVYAFTPPRWTSGLKLRVVMLADPHLIEPQMPLARWQNIIRKANALEPDLILLMGDYAGSHRFRTALIPVSQAANAAKELKAKIGTFAIMGNHDWWDDQTAQSIGQGPTIGQRAFEDAGIPVLENKAVRLVKDALPFWVSGTASLVAIKTKTRGRFEGRDDLTGTLSQVTDDAPIIHLAHEPDLFIDVPERVSLTLSGHTHGGQVRLFGWSPIVPSGYGNRFAYGHIIEGGRHLVVSAGLGCSVIPARFGSPPEITVLELG